MADAETTRSESPEATKDGTISERVAASGRQMVFSCSWAVYFTECAAKWPPTRWVEKCGKLPWEDHFIADKCHMWRYGDDLHPHWGGSGNYMDGVGGPGVADVIAFASSIYANIWRGVTQVGAFNDPDFLVVGCPTDRPCEGFSQKGEIPLTHAE